MPREIPNEPSRRGRPSPSAVRRRRFLLAGVCAIVVLIAGAIVLRGDDAGEQRIAVARAYVAAWQREDYAAMHRMLTPVLRREVTLREFTDYHRAQLRTATATAPPRAATAPTGPTVSGETVRVPLRVATRAFGTVGGAVVLPVELGDRGGIRWRADLAFPGLRRGERLRAETRLPPRADLLAADGGVLAHGPERTPDPALADVASETVGMLGPPETERARELRAQGVPKGVETGMTGLERALDDRLIGTPGGALLAGRRVLARQEPRAAAAVRTTVSPSVVRTAAAALAGRDGGAVVLDPRSGALLGYAGVPFSALRAPGSTFKMLTLSAALETGAVAADATFPMETEALLDGAPLQNADGELCGGTLIESFADSCNSVFAPLGARVGADSLARVARQFGFNQRSDIPGAATSTVPDASGGDDALTVGSTAIGQGDVMASALQMASVAATIGRDGVRPRLTLDADQASENLRAPASSGRRATSATTARVVQQAMRAVVESGTGTAAGIDGVPVAGKTGTAELGVTQGCSDEETEAGACDPDDETDTDAWFAGYAPAGPDATTTTPATSTTGTAAAASVPRVAVGVLLMRAGAGGDNAAPIARELILSALAEDDGGGDS